MNIETGLEKRIQYLLEELENESVGTERYEYLAAELQRLYDIRNDEIKIHAEEAKAYDANETEKAKLEHEKRKAETDKKLGIAGIVVTVGTFIGKIVTTVVESNKTRKFEETGVATSQTWRQWIPKIGWK